jgi:hypothetical protein
MKIKLQDTLILWKGWDLEISESKKKRGEERNEHWVAGATLFTCYL